MTENSHDTFEKAQESEGNAVHQPRIIAMMNQKGGVGKTTSTVNIGAALAGQDKRVLMLDLDPQAHMSLSLGLDESEINKTVYDLFTDNEISASQAVYSLLDEHGHSFGIMPAEVNLAGIETELADKISAGTAQTILRKKCADLIKQFDYVLIDCPPSLGLLTVNALAMAGEVIVPMQAHFLALQGLSQLLQTIQNVRSSLNENLQLAGIVLCMYEGQTVLAGEVNRDLEAFLDEARDTDLPWAGAEVFSPPIRRNIKLAESPSFGKSIFAYAPDSNGAFDYKRLAAAIVRHMES